MKRSSALVALAVTAVVLLSLSACSSAGYLAQSVGGHLHVLAEARPVQEVIDDPATPSKLRERLQLAQRQRDFAVRELALPDNASYRRYADLKRSAVVWNVVAAPELSLTLEQSCFPVVGCVGYRGYFDQGEAQAEAKRMREQGFEVFVYGVPAYSTLGRLPDWSYFSDPLLSTFINYPEGELARMVFHELAHQVAYAKGDTMFNESFATAVERVGSRLWLDKEATPEAREEFERYDARRRDFQALTFDYRRKLKALYDSAAPDAEKRAGKARLMAAMRSDYEKMRDGPWKGYKGYDSWFERANNASLGVMAAYNELVPSFEQLLKKDGGDFARFYQQVRQMAQLRTKDDRRAALAAAAGALVTSAGAQDVQNPMR